MPQCRHPGIAVVPGRGEVDVHAAGVHCGPGQRHVVLPADQPADHPERGAHHVQGGPVAGTPHSALAARWHQLAVPPGEAAVRGEVHQRVVHRAASQLADAHRQVHATVPGDRAQPLGGRRRNRHRLRVQPADELPVGPGRRAPDPVRVRRHERLGERDELRTRGGRLLDQLTGLVDGGLPVQEDRGCLDSGNDRGHW